MKPLLFRHRRLLIAGCHLIIIAISLTLAVLLRFDFSPPPVQVRLFIQALGIVLPVKMAAFLLGRFDRGWWRFVGVADLFRILLANVGASGGFTLATILLIGPSFPRSIYFVDFLLCFLGTAGARLTVRLYNELIAGEFSKGKRKGLLIYGAGAAGWMLLREIRSNPSLGYEVIGFLDDDPKKRGTDLMGVRILGSGREAPLVVDRHMHRRPNVEEIIVAMPSASGRQMQEALANCRAAGVACKTLPGIGELLSGQVLSAQVRNLSLEDLLGREAIRLEEERIERHMAGRAVLITGAAGSIGSELCRQVARLRPDKLIALDQGESELFRIDLELRGKYPSLNVIAEIGDIRDKKRVEKIIRRHGIDSIFHAAAYKHVPLMEAHLLEAVKNNIIGTWNLVQAAQQNRVSNFLMISSDKAVNPSSIMGVTKRIAELIVSALPVGAPGDRSSKFLSVRFGNVLGSNGSVVPLFQAQIAAGGPVTVTHPEMRRYFMSVREAVQLVLQASTMGKGSEIFVLDMGEPVKILDLAANMIRLAGLALHEDIEIRITGLRPGEKLYEELTVEGENILPTYHEKIKIFRGPSVARSSIEEWISELRVLLAQENELAVLAHLRELVPEYQPHRLQQQPILPALVQTANAR